jgi:hypothetical protein
MSEAVKVKGPPIPSSGGRRVPDVVWPKPRAPVHVVLLSPDIEAYYTHPILEGTGGRFVRSELCLGDQCQLAHDFHPSRWCGFTCAYRRADRAHVVVMLTPEAARSLRRLLGPEGRARGLPIRLARQSSSAASVVMVTVGAAESDAGLPAAFDCGPSLQRLWRLPVHPALMVDYGPPKGGA